MILLTGTAHILRIVTGSGGIDVRVRADWLENNAGVITPGSQNTASITTATTTTIVPAPASGKSRNVGSVNITNNHATQSTQATVEHYDGTTACPLMSVMLRPGEDLRLEETGEWRHLAPNGDVYAYRLPNGPGFLGITGSIAETMPRECCPEHNVSIATGAQTPINGIVLYAGQVINNVSICSGSQAAVSPSWGHIGIYNERLELVAEIADQTTTAWAANTLKTIPLLATYVVPKTGTYWISANFSGGTPINLKGLSMVDGVGLGDLQLLDPPTGGRAELQSYPRTPRLPWMISPSLTHYWAALS